MQHVGPSFVYVKFRCSRCKKLGQQVVKQDEWEEGVLNDATTEQTGNEKQKFEQMGSITLDEMKRFHLALEKLDTLPNDLLKDETT